MNTENFESVDTDLNELKIREKQLMNINKEMDEQNKAMQQKMNEILSKPRGGDIDLDNFDDEGFDDLNFRDEAPDDDSYDDMEVEEGKKTKKKEVRFLGDDLDESREIEQTVEDMMTQSQILREKKIKALTGGNLITETRDKTSRAGSRVGSRAGSRVGSRQGYVETAGNNLLDQVDKVKKAEQMKRFGDLEKMNKVASEQGNKI